jgi:hypothetical protein
MSEQLCQCGCGLPAPVRTYTNRSKGYAKGSRCRFVRGHGTGGAHDSVSHGQQQNAKHRATVEYRAWANAKARCENPTHPNYHHYGARGIKVLFTFGRFIAEVGQRPSAEHSIDRINNNGNYEVGNLRWATRSEQQSNRRRFKRTATKMAEIERRFPLFPLDENVCAWALKYCQL